MRYLQMFNKSELLVILDALESEIQSHQSIDKRGNVIVLDDDAIKRVTAFMDKVQMIYDNLDDQSY